MQKKIVVRSETGVGDSIMLTGVFKSLEHAFPGAEFAASVSENQAMVLMGRLRKNNLCGGKGLIDRIVKDDYAPSGEELLINLQGYIQRNTALKGDMTYLQAQIGLAERQLRNFGYNVSLPKDSLPEISFDNVPEFAKDLDVAKEKLERMKKEYGNKPVVAIGGQFGRKREQNAAELQS